MAKREKKESPFSVALSWLLKENGWGSGSRLAIAVGIMPGYVSELAAGRRKGDADLRVLICKHFKLSYDEFLHLGQWILDGKNPEDWKPSITGTGSFTMPKMKVSGRATVSPPPEPEPSIEPSTREIHRVPVISWVRAGNWSEIADPFYPGDADEWVDTTATMHPNAFALVVTGDSMEPLFHEGETIIVDPGREVINGSYVVAKNGDNEATFKQFVVDGSSVFLKPLNGRYPIKNMTGIRFSIVGVVVAKEMRF